MPRSSRRRSRKHDSWDERERSDSEEDSRPREGRPREEEKARALRGSEPEKRLSSALARPSEAVEPAALGDGDDFMERQRKRKDRNEEPFAGDDRWNGGGEDDDLSYYDSKDESSLRMHGEKSKKYKILAVDTKEKLSTMREDLDRRDESSTSKAESGKQHAEKDSESKDSTEYKAVKERGREHGADKGKESRHEGLKDSVKRKEGKARGSDKDRAAIKYNGDAESQVQDELCNDELGENKQHMEMREHSGGTDKRQGDGRGSRDRRMSSRDDHARAEGYEEEMARDERHKDGRFRNDERPRDEKYKDERSRDDERPRDQRYRDERSRDEERPRDERYRDEKSRDEERPRDERYRDERSRDEERRRDERYRAERSRDEERTRDERYRDERSRDKYREDVYRIHRHRDDRTRDERSSRDYTRDRSSNKHSRDDYGYSESRYNKNKLRDDSMPSTEERSSKYRDDNRGKKRSYEENEDDSDLKARNGKEQHGDAPKRKSEVTSFGSSVDRRREYLPQEKVNSRQRDYARKGSSISSTFPVKEQSRQMPKQEESTTRVYGDGFSGRHQRTSDFQSVEENTKTKDNMTEPGISSKDNRSSRSEKSPSESDQKFSDRNNVRLNRVTDDLQQKISTNRQSAEHCPSGSPAHLRPPAVRYGIDSPSVRNSFEEDNRSRMGEWRSSSRSRRSGTVTNARGHGNAWNSPSAWPSPVPNGFPPFQHGPPVPGFHSAIQQYPAPSLFGMRPSLDVNHAGIPYSLHDPPDRFSSHGQPFPWHNPVEDPFLARLPGWDASRNVFTDNPCAYDRPESDLSRSLDFNPQLEAGFLTRPPIEKPLPMPPIEKPLPMQSLSQTGRERSNSESCEIKRPSEIIAAKTDADATPKIKSEKKSEPAGTTVEKSPFCYNYLTGLDISPGLASPGLYKECVTIVGKLDRADSCGRLKHARLQNTNYEINARGKSSKCMTKSLFPGKTNTIYEKAMALYKTYSGSAKVKYPIPSTPKGQEFIPQTSEDQVGEENVQLPKGEKALVTAMHGGDHNDHERIKADAMDVAKESGMADDSCKTAVSVEAEHPGENVEAGNCGTNNGGKFTDKGLEDGQIPNISHGGGNALDVAEEQQIRSTNEEELPRDTKDFPPACFNAEGNVTDVAKEQLCGVISEAAFASSSQACEDVIPGCRVNLSRIPCSPGSN